MIHLGESIHCHQMAWLGMTGIPNKLYKQYPPTPPHPPPTPPHILLARLCSIVSTVFTEIDLKQPIIGSVPRTESKMDNLAQLGPLRKHIMIHTQCEQK